MDVPHTQTYTHAQNRYALARKHRAPTQIHTKMLTHLFNKQTSKPESKSASKTTSRHTSKPGSKQENNLIFDINMCLSTTNFFWRDNEIIIFHSIYSCVHII